MKPHGSHPMDARTVEQLLSGQTGATHGSRLAQRLAAIAAPAFPGELAGEDAAAAAFRVAAHAPATGRPSMIKSGVVAKLLTLKAAAVALAVVAGGGIALAAATGTLPNPLAPKSGNHSTGPDQGPGASPSPSVTGLCTAYLAGAGAEHGKALQNPAFGALITAAGGADKVDAYCARLGVSVPGSGAPIPHPTGQPTQAGHPSQPGHPTSTPSHHSGS